MADLTTTIAKGCTIQNPVMTASGTFGYGEEFAPYMDLNQLGAIITKGLSLQPSMGNFPQRVVETAGGMLNAIGLENVGVSAFLNEKLPFLKTLQVPILANIYGCDIADYVELAEILNDVPEVYGMEVNISCPNVKAGGVAFGVDSKEAEKVVSVVRKVTLKPLIVKLSPNVTDITVIAKAVEFAGADAVSLINTITGMAIDVNTQKPVLANITGGLSGPAIKPIALRMVWQTANAVKIPVIGIGGIRTATDAIEFLLAGASAVQVGTANFVYPGVTIEIIDGIKRYLEEKKISRVTDLIGTLEI